MAGSDIVDLLDLLLDEVNSEIGAAGKAVGQASEARDFVAVREAAEEAEWLVAYLDRLVALRDEWSDHRHLSGRTDQDDDPTNERRFLGRLPVGTRTPEDAYYAPILQALVELGGSGAKQDVLGMVGDKMQGILGDADLEGIPSNPDMPRWRNTASWAHDTLMKKGLLAKSSYRGIWDISEEGRQWLANQPT